MYSQCYSSIVQIGGQTFCQVTFVTFNSKHGSQNLMQTLEN